MPAKAPRMPGIDRDLRTTLGVTSWTDYEELLGSASFTTAEGEESTLALGETSTVSPQGGNGERGAAGRPFRALRTLGAAAHADAQGPGGAFAAHLGSGAQPARGSTQLYVHIGATDAWRIPAGPSSCPSQPGSRR